MCNKYIRKTSKKEKKERVHRAINKDLDLRSNFLGLRQLKRKYEPIPYVIRFKNGKKVPFHQREEAAADYYENNVWKKSKILIALFTLLV